MSSYFEKLKDPRWQRKRLEAMEVKDFTCECCGDASSTLNVHHKAYFKGREPWEYEADQLTVLCELCHQDTHSKESFLKAVTSYVLFEDEHLIGSLVAGYIGLEHEKILHPKEKLEDDEEFTTACTDGEAYQVGYLAKMLYSRYNPNLIGNLISHMESNPLLMDAFMDSLPMDEL